MKKFILILSVLSLTVSMASAQKWAVKTNVAYWATATTNLGTELALGRKTTLDIVGMYNPFTFNDNKKMKLWGVQPEFRLWTCQRFVGHFFGLHGHYGQYNAGLNTFRYDGWLAGAGISYGYQWVLGKRWNLETELGVGYAYMKYDRHLREKCQKFVDHKTSNYFGPTKLSISFVYFIK